MILACALLAFWSLALVLLPFLNDDSPGSAGKEK